MGTKLRGMLNLSRIPKGLIVENKNGEKIIWVDIMENLGGADQYGNTHSISVYDKEQHKAVYLGNFKPQEFGQGAAQQPSNATETVMGNMQDAVGRKMQTQPATQLPPDADALPF